MIQLDIRVGQKIRLPVLLGSDSTQKPPTPYDSGSTTLLNINIKKSSFEPVVTIHWLAELDLGAGVEQPFKCLIIQNRQTVVLGEVDGWYIGGQYGRRFVPLRHAHRPQKRPYPICASRNENVRHRCGGG